MMDPEYDYHGDFANKSKTMLSLFLQSPMEYHLTYNTLEMKPKAPKKRMIEGLVGHAVLLEGKKMNQLALMYPDSCLNKNGDINPKPAEQFRIECEGYFCLKPSDYRRVEDAINGMMKHGDFMADVEGAASKEVPYFSELFGLPCKCKPDILLDWGHEIRLIDPKFMENIDPDSFWRSAKMFQYWLQQVHYSSIVANHFGKPVTFRFRAIETKFPYRQQDYFYKGSDLENAITGHEKLLTRLKERYDSGNWDDNWEEDIRLGPWDCGMDDEREEVFNFDGEPEDLDI